MSFLTFILSVATFIGMFIYFLHLVIESDKHLPNRVYSSPWKYNYRYCIYVDSGGRHLNIILWKRNWNKRVKISSWAAQREKIQEMYMAAHECGNEKIEEITSLYAQINKLKTYGRQRSLFGKIALVRTKYSL